MAACIQRFARHALSVALLLLVEGTDAQTTGLLTPPPRPASQPAAPAATLASNPAPPPARTTESLSGLKITKGQGVLPNDQGKVWREYDISPYTLRVRDVAKPEQSVIDWILRETGTDIWFSDPLGIL